MRPASATPVTQQSSCNAAKAASGPLLAQRTKKKWQEFFKELQLLKAEFHSLGLPLKRLLQPFPVLRMCGKDLSKPTTFPLLKTHPSKHTHQNASSFAGDDFPSCSVSPSLSKAPWYLLKSIPGDSKMRFTAVLCWSKDQPCLHFWDAQAPHPREDSGRDRGSLLEDSPQQPPLVLFLNPTNTQSKRRRWRLPWQALVPHGWRGSIQPWSHWRSKLGNVSHSNLCSLAPQELWDPSGFPSPLRSLAVTRTPF